MLPTPPESLCHARQHKLSYSGCVKHQDDSVSVVSGCHSLHCSGWEYWFGDLPVDRITQQVILKGA